MLLEEITEHQQAAEEKADDQSDPGLSPYEKLAAEYERLVAAFNKLLEEYNALHLKLLLGDDMR